MSTVQNLNSIQNFLNNLNYNNIYLYPFNNDPLKVAIHVRNFTEIQVLTGEELLLWNVEREALRLQVNNRNIIHLATNDIWNLHLTDLQKNQFTDLADKANSINQDFVQTNEDTLNRIYQIDLLQGANTPLENHIFNGVAF
ncbi:hypothetical protein RhiirA1_488865 [Rhizophagus irregularis]|uniref:Uncharacterized protein n=1 Tax=Rhizophagus irregularis TaxID=588596 RepID=A0A2I1FA60_9GLOM|nr:hypothetical protein RhiirA1_488865 [Rhizophagus irregularis]PKY31258.1 hypothetical protein RhiirB3_531497 [Rhizophagus irregularis]